MTEHKQAAGQTLRKLRKLRKLTLQKAAPALQISVPVLSRKERGQEKIERKDIRQAIAAYEVTPWEAYELWTAAGFIPEPTVPPPRQYDLRDLAQALLPNLPFPAFITDMLWYIRAWNQGVEEIWHASQSGAERLHIVDDLFSERVRQRLGDHWDQYVVQAVKVFYTRTVRIANDPAYLDLIEELRTRHGQAFIDTWNAAQQSDWLRDSLPPVDMGGTMVMYDSPFGIIEYMVMQAVFHFPHEYELIMYVPFGAANLARYNQLRATIDGQHLYFRD